MKERYSNLREKTVLDFCQTEYVEDFIRRFFLLDMTKEDFKKRMMKHPELNAASLGAFADYMGDAELLEQVYAQFDGLIAPPLLED